MATIQILPQGLPEEADDTPKKFTNIDNEPFEFWWDNKPYGGIFSDRFVRRDDRVVINADGKEDRYPVFEITNPIQPKEIVLMPKYLVNYAATHLAKKIYKRQAYASFKGTEMEKQNAAIRFINPEEQIKLMKLMVAENFPQEPKPEIVVPTAETVVDKKLVETPEKPSFKCDKCEFEAKSKAGVLAHARRKHKVEQQVQQ